jgi:hypothetical protein
LAKDELPRVRAAALAWRNGIAALLAGLVGFGLVKGRTDIGELAAPYDAVVGVLLLAALISGIAAALWLLRAAHGRPAALVIRDAAAGAGDGVVGLGHAETLRALRALRWGLVTVLASVALLCAAVATTWYGPARDKPRIEVSTIDGTVCGEVVRLVAGRLTLKTTGGEVVVDLRDAVGIRAVAACPSGSG